MGEGGELGEELLVTEEEVVGGGDGSEVVGGSSNPNKDDLGDLTATDDLVNESIGIGQVGSDADSTGNEDEELFGGRVKVKGWVAVGSIHVKRDFGGRLSQFEELGSPVSKGSDVEGDVGLVGR